MTASDTFNQLSTDLEKTLASLLNVRTTNEIHAARQVPGYTYNSKKGMHEYWIALGQYSFSTNLSYLSFVINATEQILPTNLQTKHDLAIYVDLFKVSINKVIAAFDTIIGKPNQVFISYAEPITMEQYLQTVVSDIHEEALNLEYNFQQLQSLS